MVTSYFICYNVLLSLILFPYFLYNGLRAQLAGRACRVQAVKFKLQWARDHYLQDKSFAEAFLTSVCAVLPGSHKVRCIKWCTYMLMCSDFLKILWFFSSTEFQEINMRTVDNYGSGSKESQTGAEYMRSNSVWYEEHATELRGHKFNSFC